MNTPQLRRVRWAVRATLVLGLAASTVGNILHANPNPISQTISAWPVAALYLTIELISRIPVHRRSLAFARLFAAAIIAGIAAWVSYWHMAGVTARYGETGASSYLLPLSVDGLIVVTSICLVELGGRIRDAQQVAAVAHPSIDTAPPAPPKPPAPAAPVSAPPAAADEPVSGAPAPDEPAGQEVRQDERPAHLIEAAVRAIKAADPDLSQRKIAAAVAVSPTKVRRILERPADPEATQQAEGQINGKEPALVGTPGETEER